MRHIIVVEDERDLADLVALHLEREGYGVTIHENGSEGWEAIQSQRPDLVVLDLMLPGMDGFEICRRMRRADETADTPILMMTARGEDIDIVTGLELGADDYCVKPVSPRILVARIRALLRREAGAAEAAAGERKRVGPIELDTSRFEVRVDKRPIDLTYTEFKVLEILARRPGHVRTRADILDAIGDGNVLERTVDVHMASLRKKLGDAGTYLETVRGIGYRMKE